MMALDLLNFCLLMANELSEATSPRGPCKTWHKFHAGAEQESSAWIGASWAWLWCQPLLLSAAPFPQGQESGSA